MIEELNNCYTFKRCVWKKKVPEDGDNQDFPYFFLCFLGPSNTNNRVQAAT